MIDPILIAKIVTSIFFVMGLSLIAENVSPKVAGVLSGYPLGTAIILFFVGLENGSGFAAKSASYTLGGLSASLIFIYIYYGSSIVFPKSGALLASFLAVAGFLCVAGILSQLTLSLAEGLLIVVSAILMFSFLFRKIENVKINSKVKLTYKVLFLRAILAALIVVLITTFAKTVGSEWAGVLSAFPVTLYPFLLIIHVTYGKQYAHTVIKNFPHGLGALVTYIVAVSFMYPAYGIYYGTLLCFIFATLYLVAYTIATRYLVAKIRNRI